MEHKKERCGSCVFQAGPLNVFRCNYAGLTGKTRKAEPPERCSFYRRGKRCETPEDLEKPKEEIRRDTAKKAKIDWTAAKTLYDAGMNDTEIGQGVGCSAGTVCSWRHRRGLPANRVPGWRRKA